MTRVAIIGNSHVGAYVDARAAIAAAFPGLDLSFFAFPRHNLNSAHYGADGVISVVGDHNLSLPQRLDLSTQDHVLMVGQPFGMIALNALLARFDILGWRGAGRANSVSPALFADFLAGAVKSAFLRLLRYVRQDPRFTFAPQPLVAAQTPPGTSKMASVAAHPEAPRLFGLWQGAINSQTHDAPCPVMLQPPALCDGPVFTAPRFARLADLPAGQAPQPADFIHMNAGYGLAHFTAFAQTRLGLTPRPAPPSTKES